MIIRKAHKKDLNDIMKMYESCVNGMIKNKIDQWDSSYPNSEIIKADILASTYYVAEINNNIIGGINIDQNQDPTYLKISWEDNSNSFLVVHRLAVKEESWGENIGKKHKKHKIQHKLPFPPPENSQRKPQPQDQQPLP